MARVFTKRERQTLQRLTLLLREAAVAAIAKPSAMARDLDESRCDVERLLMQASCDPADYERIIRRANMILDAGRALGFVDDDHAAGSRH